MPCLNYGAAWDFTMRWGMKAMEKHGHQIHALYGVQVGRHIFIVNIINK